MPVFDVYLARTFRVRMEAPDEALAERLAEEYVGPVKDQSAAEQQAEGRFHILSIEMTDNHAFDAILIDEG